MHDFDMPKRICIATLSIALAAFAIGLFIFATDSLSYKNAVSSGYVTSKETGTRLFSDNIQYCITVETEIMDERGQIIIVDKNFVVDKDVYMSANIGDYYDNNTLSVTSAPTQAEE